MNPGDNKWVGVMGGGQLGRMLSLDARRMGLKVLAWTGGDRSGAASTADELLDDSFESQTALEKFCYKVNVATVEFENLPAKTLQNVEKRIPLYPNSRTISICQHREKEKQFLSKNGFNCVKFKIAHDIDTFKDGIKALEYHAIVKTAEFGYDGKGQIKISKPLTEEEISNIWKTFEGGRVVIEELISLKAELSVLVVRNVNGEIKTYDPAENIHRDHILDVSIVPARLPQPILEEAENVALEIADQFNYIGVLAVEFFLSSDGRLLVNEMAPRPHNSGHHTINACITSQFENQARAITGLPLGSTKLTSPAVMMNLLGDLWVDEKTPPDWRTILKEKNSSLHLYDKGLARKGRKMGHATLTSNNINETVGILNLFRNNFNLPNI